MKENICVSIEKTVVEELDRARGELIPRSRFVEDVLKKALPKKGG